MDMMTPPEVSNPAVAEEPISIAQLSLPITTPDSTPDDAIAMGTPVPPVEEKRISVYANGIREVSFDLDDPVAAFDVTFRVCVVQGDTTKTYQVVKRIGVDKLKIANDAETTTPISIVEAKKPTNGIPTSRFKKLAGL